MQAYESNPSAAVELALRLPPGPELEQVAHRIGPWIEDPALRTLLAGHLERSGLGDRIPPPARGP